MHKSLSPPAPYGVNPLPVLLATCLAVASSSRCGEDSATPEPDSREAEAAEAERINTCVDARQASFVDCAAKCHSDIELRNACPDLKSDCDQRCVLRGDPCDAEDLAPCLTCCGENEIRCTAPWIDKEIDCRDACDAWCLLRKADCDPAVPYWESCSAVEGDNGPSSLAGRLPADWVECIGTDDC